MISGTGNQETTFITPQGKKFELDTYETRTLNNWLSTLNDENENSFKDYPKPNKPGLTGLYMALAIFNKKPKFTLYLYNINKADNSLSARDIAGCINNITSTQVGLINQLLECLVIRKTADRLLLLKALVSNPYVCPTGLITHCKTIYKDCLQHEIRALRIILEISIDNDKFDKADEIIKHFHEIQSKNKKVIYLTIELIEKLDSDLYRNHFYERAKKDKAALQIQECPDTIAIVRTKIHNLYFSDNLLLPVTRFIKDVLEKNCSPQDMFTALYQSTNNLSVFKYKTTNILIAYIKRQAVFQLPDRVILLYIFAEALLTASKISESPLLLQQDARAYAKEHEQMINGNLLKLFYSNNNNSPEPTIKTSIQTVEEEIATNPSANVQMSELTAIQTPLQTQVSTRNPTKPSRLKDNYDYLPETPDSHLERPPKANKTNPLQAGIANKYLGLDSIPSLPEKIAHGEGAPLLPNQLGLKSQIRATSEIFERKENIIKNNSAIMKFYTTRAITEGEKVLFVFAGRKENACYPEHPGNCRVVSVMSKLEYKNSDLPESIDILVIENLYSHSHGDYSDNLGCINSRRIAAMLMAYDLNLQSCIFMDDNLKTINTSNEKTKDWGQLFDELNNHRANKVCLSVRTHLYRAQAFQQRTLGSKLFMVDISQLKTKLPNKADVFNLFFPNSCGNYWAEDYFMQLIMVKAFGQLSVSIADKNSFTLSRLSQFKSVCAKVTQKALQHIQLTPEKFLECHFEYHLLDANASSLIHFAIKSIQQIVHGKIAYHTTTAKINNSVNLLESHAEANHIPYIDEINLAAIANTIDSSASNISIDDFELYPHQCTAIQAITQSTRDFELVQMTTGAGKTRLQITLAQINLNKDPSRPIFIVTPTKQLVQQFYDDFIEDIRNNKASILAPHQIVKVSSNINDISAATLETNDSLRGKPVVMIFCKASFLKYIKQKNMMVPQRIFLDESHMFKDTHVVEIQVAFQTEATKILALSATPAKWMTNKHTHLYTYPRKEGVKDKVLSPFILNTVDEEYSKNAVEKYIQSMHKFLTTHTHPNGQKLNTLKGIIYLPNIRDVQTCAELLSTNMHAYQAHSQETNCQQQIEQFSQSTEPCVILAVRMLRVGFSDKNLDFVLDLQKQAADDIAQKANDNAQKAGRVMRYRKGKIGYAVGFRDYDSSNFETVCDEEALFLCHDEFKKQSPALFSREHQPQSTYMPYQSLTNTLVDAQESNEKNDKSKQPTKEMYQSAPQPVISWLIKDTQIRYTGAIPPILIETALNYGLKTISFPNNHGKSIWLTLEETTPKSTIQVQRPSLIELGPRYREDDSGDNENEKPCKRPRFY